MYKILRVEIQGFRIYEYDGIEIDNIIDLKKEIAKTYKRSINDVFFDYLCTIRS